MPSLFQGFMGRTLLTVGVVLVVVLGLGSVLSIRTDLARQLETLETRAELLASMQAGGLAQPMWTMNNDQVAAALESLEADPDFAFARVVDSDGQTVATHGRPDPAGMAEATETIRNEDEALGTIELGLSRAGAYEIWSDQVFWAVVEVVAAIGAVMAILALLLGRLLGPLGRLTGVMERLAAGEANVSVPGQERSDQVGAIARAIEVFRQNRLESEVLRRQQETERAAAAERSHKALMGVADTFERTIATILEQLAREGQALQQKASGVAEIAGRTSTATQAVASSSEQAATNVEMVASAAEELSASIQEVARQVAGAARLAKDAVVQVEQTNHTVESLSEAAGRIGDVVKLIKGIADQTNLLALNATIEAARAGDAGKGFAVVAQEVKALADQTAKATEEIAAQVQEIQSVSQGAASAIGRIGESIIGIDQGVGSVSAAAEQQSVSTAEITRNVQTAASGSMEVSRTIRTMSRDAEEASQLMAAVLSSTEVVNDQLDKLRRASSDFVDKVRHQ